MRNVPSLIPAQIWGILAQILKLLGLFWGPHIGVGGAGPQNPNIGGIHPKNGGGGGEANQWEQMRNVPSLIPAQIWGISAQILEVLGAFRRFWGLPLFGRGGKDSKNPKM